MVIINLITCSRIIATLPAFFINSVSWLLAISVWAAFSDFIDGILARKFQMTSTFGARLDQMADKLFHFTMLICMLRLDLADTLFVWAFFTREALIVILRYLQLCDTRSNPLGKIKTALTYGFILYALAGISLFSISMMIMNISAMIWEACILTISYTSLVLAILNKPKAQE